MNDFCVYNSVICIEFIPSTQTFGKVKKKKQKKAATIKSEELSNKVTFESTGFTLSLLRSHRQLASTNSIHLHH